MNTFMIDLKSINQHLPISFVVVHSVKTFEKKIENLKKKKLNMVKIDKNGQHKKIAIHVFFVKGVIVYPSSL